MQVAFIKFNWIFQLFVHLWAPAEEKLMFNWLYYFTRRARDSLQAYPISNFWEIFSKKTFILHAFIP